MMHTQSHTLAHFCRMSLKCPQHTLCSHCMNMGNGMIMVLLLLLLLSFTIKISDRKIFKRICVKILCKQRHKKVP